MSLESISVSVIIPTYRRRDLLGRALRSVLNQTRGDFECIVVNDCPADGGELARLVAELGDARVRLHSNHETGGAAFSRNVGIAQSRGEILAFLDDDDEWHPQKLESHLRHHAAQPDIAVFYSGCVFRWEGDVLPPTEYPPEHLPAGRDNIIKALADGTFGPTTPSAFTVRRAVFNEVAFDERLVSLADWDLWFQIAQKHPAPFAAVSENLAIYRLHLGKRMSVSESTRLKGLAQVREKYGSAYDLRGLERRCRKQLAHHTAYAAALTNRRVEALRTIFGYVERASLADDLREAAKVALLCIGAPLYRFVAGAVRRSRRPAHPG